MTHARPAAGSGTADPAAVLVPDDGHRDEHHNEERVGRVDAWQRRHPVVGLPLAVLYKFFDDQAGYLAVVITYYGFVSAVPMLLLATTTLGFALQGDPELRARVLESAVASFPVVGDQLGRPEGLQGSTTAVVVGSIAALYGSLGLGSALQNAVNTVWAVPRNNRPNPVLLRLNSLVLLLSAGLGLLALGLLPAVLRLLLDWSGPVASWLVPLASGSAMVGLLATALWLAAGRRQPMRVGLPGAVLVAVAWQLVQAAATAIAGQTAAQASAMNQTFGLVLGLVAVTYVASLALLLGMELNVVLHRSLWPRALLTPFTDRVRLTPGDRRAYAGYARAQRHKGFQYVVVGFKERRRAVTRTPRPDEDSPT